MSLACGVTFRRAARIPWFGPAAVLCFACVASFALSWVRLEEVWRTGTFFDTDDAMRMVEVRDWLSGQTWFDMTAHRLSPPGGLPMHWSRIVDVPIGMLVRFFGLFSAPVEAERLARIVFPLACQALLIVAFPCAARVLCGRNGIGPALLVITLDGFQFGQFTPGRIDHHAPQIVLLVAMLGAVAAGVRGGGAAAGIVAAAAMALSLGISLENLPFMLVLVLAVALLWWRRGPSAAPFTQGFGAGLAGGVALVFAATVPPARYGIVTNDALSLPHGVLGVGGGLGLAIMARLEGFHPSATKRALGLAGLSVALAVAVLLLCPGFPASPYAGVDPVVRDLWLRHVSEAMPLWASIGLHPSAIAITLVPLAAGGAACLVAAGVSRGPERSGWLVVTGLVGVGLIGACWEVRVTTSTMPLAALGGAWVVTRVSEARWRGAAWTRQLRLVVAALPFSPIACALLPAPEDAATVAASAVAAQSCRDARNLAPLASLPPGLAFAPIDVGSHLLAGTSLSVLAAPYHRNDVGNRAVLDGLVSTPDAARAKVVGTGADYVVVCPGEAQLAVIAGVAPASLAAHLATGDAPAWLRPVEVGPTAYRVYRIQ